MEKYKFAPLVPELKVANIRDSLHFWCEGLGFAVAYDRPEEGFAYLEHEGSQIMLDQYDSDSRWIVGAMERPLGRGINIQMFVTDVSPILDSLAKLDWPLFWPLEDKWYRVGAIEAGNRQFLVQDPDGYLLRFAQDLGDRPVGD